jgi:hypothetical protein
MSAEQIKVFYRKGLGHKECGAYLTIGLMPHHHNLVYRCAEGAGHGFTHISYELNGHKMVWTDDK